MRVAVTYYPVGEHEVTRWFYDMPAIPRTGETVFFDDRAWHVAYVSYAPDSNESETPGDTSWHAELSVR